MVELTVPDLYVEQWMPELFLGSMTVANHFLALRLTAFRATGTCSNAKRRLWSMFSFSTVFHAQFLKRFPRNPSQRITLWSCGFFFIRPHYVSFITPIAIISQKISQAVSINYPGRKCENLIFLSQHVCKQRLFYLQKNCTATRFSRCYTLL